MLELYIYINFGAISVTFKIVDDIMCMSFITGFKSHSAISGGNVKNDLFLKEVPSL